MYWSIKGPKVSVEWLASKPTLAILVCILSSIEAHHRAVSSEGECPVILALTKSSTFTFNASVYLCDTFPNLIVCRLPSACAQRLNPLSGTMAC